MTKMRQGLLWFDADPKRGLAEKVGRAADRYRAKFGRWPNACYVNASMLRSAGGVLGQRNEVQRDPTQRATRPAHGPRPASSLGQDGTGGAGFDGKGTAKRASDQGGDGSVWFDGVRVVPAHYVLRHHFWIGVEDIGGSGLRDAA